MVKEQKGGVTAPAGFRASGVLCGIKGDPEALDLGILCSDVPASVAGVFTTNSVKGAPVLVSSARARRGTCRAVVVNSGNANVCTGSEGMANAEEMARRAAERLGCAEEDVLVASTGVIGRKLPMDQVRRGVDAAAALEAGGDAGTRFARAILTTDRGPKEVAARFPFGKGMATLGGAVKGAGMIAPNMATMLCFVTTDAAVAPGPLRAALVACVDGTLNRITVDGHMSTSDTALVFANGQCGGRVVTEPAGQDFERFSEALTYVLGRLGEMLVAGAEGVTRVATITVDGGACREDAEVAARAVANSALVKTALHGGDPNWGRIISAVGAVLPSFDPAGARLSIGKYEVFAGGEPTDVPMDTVAAAMRVDDVAMRLSLGKGPGKYTMVTCDLSREYVAINADYTT